MELNAYKNPHAFIQKQIKMGLIVRPSECSKCFSVGKVVAHHNDYSKPSEITWLCNKCHKIWHANHGRGKNYELYKDKNVHKIQIQISFEQKDKLYAIAQKKRCFMRRVYNEMVEEYIKKHGGKK